MISPSMVLWVISPGNFSRFIFWLIIWRANAVIAQIVMRLKAGQPKIHIAATAGKNKEAS
jgi:hypothetical protein